jgi:hypothetical protein
VLDDDGNALQELACGAKWLRAELAPGAGLRLRITMTRYVNQPTYDTPWVEQKQVHYLFKGRTLA